MPLLVASGNPTEGLLTTGSPSHVLTGGATVVAYAEIADLGSEWAALIDGERDDVERGLQEASTLVNVALAQAGMDPADVEAEVLRLVVCRMVRRAFPIDQGGIPIGVESVQASLGSFQNTFRWGSGRSGELVVYREEKRILGIAARAFSLDLLPEEYSQ